METVIKLLELPAKVLKFDHLDRGRKRKFLIQKRLVEVIRESKRLAGTVGAEEEKEDEPNYENWKNDEPKTKISKVKKGVEKILRRAKSLVR